MVPRLIASRLIALLCVLLPIALSASRPILSVSPTKIVAETGAPEVTSYRMNVSLDPVAKMVAGTERITYRNPSQDTLHEVWLRLYLRAFRSPDTVWMRESRGGLRGFPVDAEHLGDITVSRLGLVGGADLLARTTLTDTLMHVPLPRPLGPGQTVEFDAAWTSKLPRVFARTGYGGRDDTFFMVGQWYPKLAVYDRGHWDTEPWHANSEFFNDFGSYDVQITVPRQYVVAGVGVPAAEPQVSGNSRMTHFSATSVTDFAFAASPDFRTRTARAGDVDVVLYYLPEHEASVAEYMETSTGSLQAYSAWYGAYPHPRLTVVDVPDNAGGAGGMEYPTLVTGGKLGLPAGSGAISVVVSHEIGHQWWPMQTATNEGREPWLDEGITEYSGIRYLAEVKRNINLGVASIGAFVQDRAEYATTPREPSTLPAWKYSEAEYGAAVYGKTALGLWTLEGAVGTARFRHAMADYLERYRWKHPAGSDFRASLEQSLGGDLTWFFDDYLSGTGVVDYAAGALANSGTGSTARVERKGQVRAPVEIQITLAGGGRQRKVWDGHEASTTYTFPAGDPVAKVEVDPEHKLRAELDVLNNGATVRPLVGPAVTLGGRLAFVTQVIVQLLGLFG